MHYKDYIHHDFYVYSPVLLTQYLGHCWHTPCTELYILRISAWLLRKPPLPCHRGGGTIWLGEGGVWGSLLIYTLYTHKYTYEYMDFIGFNSPRGDLGIRGGVLSPVDLPLMYGDWVWRYTLETTPCGWDMKSPKGWRTFGVLVGWWSDVTLDGNLHISGLFGIKHHVLVVK